MCGIKGFSSIKNELLIERKKDIENYLYGEDFNEQYFLGLVKDFRKLRKEILDEEYTMFVKLNDKQIYRNFENVLDNLIKK